MADIRYVRTSSVQPELDPIKHFSAHPFPLPTTPYFSEYIHVTLSNGVFVCGHERSVPNYTLKTKARGFYLHFIVSGKGTYNDLPFGENEMFAIHPQARKDTQADANDPWELYWCVWKGDAAIEMQNKFNLETNRVYHLKNAVELKNLFRYMIYTEHRAAKMEKIAKCFSDILASDLLIEEHAEEQEDPRAPLVAEIQTYINRHLPDVTVEKVAKQFAYSRKYLTANVFRKVTGITLRDYIQNTKLGYAENCLLSTQLPIGEVATRAGYSGYSSFVKAFKQKYGMTPSEFIRKNRV